MLHIRVRIFSIISQIYMCIYYSTQEKKLEIFFKNLIYQQTELEIYLKISCNQGQLQIL